MIEFKYKDKDEWKVSAWPWVTLDSMQTTLLDSSVRNPKIGKTMADAVELRGRLSSMVTVKNIGRRSKVNARASVAAINENRAQSIKDLFTAPCPTCKTIGEAVPRERPEYKNVLPGLYCPKCDVWFPPRSKYQERPVFAVAAGPSLDKNLNELSRVKGQYPIFAVDTALPTMIKGEIKPDFIVSVEVDPLINEMEIDTTDIGLIASIVVDPIFRNKWKGPVYLVDGYPGTKREEAKKRRSYKDLGWAAAGGNVSSIMLSMLTGIFASHIIFVGHDFSYPHLQNYYSSGGPMSMIPIKEVFKTHDIYGKETFTDGSLYNYREWSQMMIAQQSRYGITKFVNATEGGILGTTYYDPKKFIKLKRYFRELSYSFSMLKKEKRWPSREEAQENGFRGPNISCLEYTTLKEAIDKYCPQASKE
jgi:hypothetical protein